jgi:hypothetical protein
MGMGVSSAGVVGRHIRRRYKTGMQHRRVLGDKTIQLLGQKPHHLALRWPFHICARAIVVLKLRGERLAK